MIRIRRAGWPVLLRICTALLVAIAVAAPAVAEERIALVIGNGDYGALGSLKNPVNDSRLMAATLREMGFRVIEIENADQRDMKRGVRDFGRWLRRAGTDAVALFYYAGHGVQVAGENYLLPVEAVIEAEGDVDIEAVSAGSILEQMQHANTGVNIVILDACRNNPFQREFRSAASGLARMDAPTGTYIAYATAPGQLAVDGAGAHSPFTETLSRVMREPGLGVEQVFKKVRQMVAAATGEKQVPWSSSSLIGDFAFNTRKADPPAAAAPAASRPAEVRPETPREDIELAYWESIMATDNAGLFRSYLERYPAGIFAEIARERIRAIETPVAAAPAATVRTVPEAAPSDRTPAPAVEGCDSRRQSEPDAIGCIQVKVSGRYPVSRACQVPQYHEVFGGQMLRLRQGLEILVRKPTSNYVHGSANLNCYEMSLGETDGLLAYDGWYILVTPSNEAGLVLTRFE
ncbi:caspase family protein [Minwuia thermotolerans]|uniref:Caspase family p20 domain-containing protein n=1 Tax=Minwuia thermotolerans TaxID=2056226 RepID=A0A2M9G195_9PROT|nr:caspase family protein [Minwuia thermotolerans]PJK29481.1 hypothetical protein CVT23_10480 [Minwuia thermotolerans]